MLRLVFLPSFLSRRKERQTFPGTPCRVSIDRTRTVGDGPKDVIWQASRNWLTDELVDPTRDHEQRAEYKEFSLSHSWG